jgi:hypothetical protein
VVFSLGSSKHLLRTENVLETQLAKTRQVSPGTSSTPLPSCAGFLAPPWLTQSAQD